jgi:hypothetical protein
MAYKAINNIQAVDLDSLDASSATKEYPLGTVIEVNDTSKGGVSQFMYVKAHAAFATVGTPFMQLLQLLEHLLLLSVVLEETQK